MTRTHRFRLAAIGLGALLALAIGEGVVRLLALRPLAVKVHAVVPDKTENPLGLRDQLDRIPKGPELLRIAFLGDSFTYGLGIEREQTFVYQTGLLLARRYSGRSMTINLGRDGADLIGEWSIYNYVRDSVRPQIVVHVISQNDLDFDLYRSFDPIAKLVTDRTWISRHSKLVDMLESTVRLRMASDRSLIYMQGGATPEQRDRTWRLVEHVLAATKKLVEDGGAIYCLARFPWLREVHADRDYRLAMTSARTRQVAERLGVPYLALLDAFRGQPADAMCLLPYDDHPTAAAHEIAAEALCTFLIREVVPKVRLGALTDPDKKRTTDEVEQAEMRFYEGVLAVDPNCFSGRYHLESLSARRKDRGRPATRVSTTPRESSRDR